MGEHELDFGLSLELTDVSEATMNRLPAPTGDAGFESPDQLVGLLEELLEIGVELEDAVNHSIDYPDDYQPEPLVAQAAEMLDASINLVQRIANHSSHPLDEAAEFGDARFAVSMAIDELDRQRRVVSEVDPEESGRERVLTIVAEAKGVTTQALINVERALCADSHREPQLGEFLSLEDSLEIRRVYGKMRRALLKFERHKEAPSHAEVVARLRRAGTSFVQLRGHDCYQNLRVEDRFEFDRLWDRVYGWLQTESAGENTYAGWLIWEDILNFVELIGSINFQQELREHDIALASRMLPRFDERDAQDPLGEELAAELSRLSGYSPVIDALIEQGPDASVDDWRQQLRSIEYGG